MRAIRLHMVRTVAAVLAMVTTSSHARPVFDTGGTSTDLFHATRHVANKLADVDEDGVPDLVSITDIGFMVRLGGGGIQTESRHFTRFACGSGYSNEKAWIEVVDLNADGHLDVVTGAEGWMPFRWLGNGDGTFGSCGLVPRFGSYVHLFRDFDGDPYPDVAYGGNYAFAVYRNPGGPSMDSTVVAPYPLTGVRGLGAADIDEDGIVDIVASRDWPEWTWGYILGIDDGSYEDYLPVASAAGGSIFVLDVDSDSHADVIVGGAMYRGHGDATFTLMGDLGFEPDTVTDVDRDGEADFVAIDGDRVTVRYGDGNWGFSAPESRLTGHLPSNVITGDIDTDGVVDLLVGCESTPLATVLYGTAPRGFRDAPSFPTGAEPVAIVVGEFTGDGIVDVVTANRAGGSVAVLPGLGDGTLGPPVPYAAPAGVRDLVVADLDGGGRDDLIAVADSSGMVSVYRGLAGGGFASRVDYPTGGGPTRIALGQWDHDGEIDLAVADSSWQRVLWMKGDGHGGFGAPILLENGEAREVAMVDLDHDGNADIIYNRLESTSLSPNQYVLYGDGAGGLITRFPNSLGSGGGIRSWFAVGEVTSDGWPDLVVATRQDSSTSVRSHVWTAGVMTVERDSISPSVTGIRLADVDGDGHLDALTTSDHANAVTVRYGRGDGTFGPRHDHLAGDGAADLAVADFDGDGDLDVAVANARDNTVSVLENLTAPTTDAPRPRTPATAFALHGAWPNPSRGALRVSFVLPDDRPARLEVWDVTGRRVAARDVGGFGAGAHRVEMQNGQLPPGVYLLRLSRAGESLERRVAIVR